MTVDELTNLKTFTSLMILTCMLIYSGRPWPGWSDNSSNWVFFFFFFFFSRHFFNTIKNMKQTEIVEEQ